VLSYFLGLEGLIWLFRVVANCNPCQAANMDVRIGVPVNRTWHVEQSQSGCGNFMWLVAVSTAGHTGKPVALQVVPVRLMWLQ